MTKFFSPRGVVLKDPPMTIKKGSVVTLREITTDVQEAVDAGLMVIMSSTGSPPSKIPVVETPMSTSKQGDFQKVVLSTLSSIQLQLQDILEKIETSHKKRK